ncbi:MAG: DUF3822 family protein [Duncaniella sp.]|nr:DUF3822 family protein [Duncaniella sp.]
MSAATPLTKDLVPDTSMWTLAMRLSSRAVDIALFTDMEDNSLLYRRCLPAAGTPSVLRAIEDIVYENPLVLSGFRRTFISIVPEASMMLPAALPCATDVLAATLPGDDREWAVDTAASRNASIGYCMPRGCTGFIDRTFGAEAVVRPHLGYLASYFITRTQRGRHCRMLVNLRSDSLDIVAARGGDLIKAVTFKCSSAMDAAYYILACRAELSFDDSDSEIIIAGDAAMRAEVMPIVRRFAANVIPVIFPPRMFRAGRPAMDMPFDLTVAPLCE